MAAPRAPPAARTGMLVAGAAPFDFFVLELAAVVDECFALSACPLLMDIEAEVVAAADDWLEVAAEAARTAILKAKNPESCILTVAAVRLEDWKCEGYCGLMVLMVLMRSCVASSNILILRLLCLHASLSGDHSCLQWLTGSYQRRSSATVPGV